MAARGRAQLAVVLKGSLYVARCTIAGSLAYTAANVVGLEHPVWASVSALVVSQESATGTYGAIWGRFLGTLNGVMAAVSIGWVGAALHLSLALQIAAGVALCAALTIGRPHIRVSLWTCPVVLATAAADAHPALVAISRVAEVVLGAGVGAGLALLMEGRYGSRVSFATHACRRWTGSSATRRDRKIGGKS
ncbi:FUSC family protein [Phenylobacterium sp.]|uniref:FUSC family protein n=1 Tax=Phenylobacterium sp. TaxID=1871053 RepID=UPI002DE783A2|nr:FUSC family protein [Phenylobacterium sp.]